VPPKRKLKEICIFSNEKIDMNNLNTINYISTENMLADKAGVTRASSIPTSGKATKYEVGDILLSNIRPYFKKIWFANNIGGSSNDVLVIRNKMPEQFDNRYLYYCLVEDKFFNYVVSGSKGTKMPRGDKKSILDYEIYVPVLDIQRKIAAILFSIDQKIELNNSMNKVLEQMAQAIFKQWFVDFEFPNENGEPYKSSGGEMVWCEELGKEIPKGWELNLISDVISVKDGTHDSPKSSPKGFPLVTSKHLKENRIDFSDANLICETDYNKVNERSKVDRFDILISMIGTIGTLYLVQDRDVNFAIKNIGLFKTSEKESLFEYVYFHLKSDFISNHIKERLAGSTQQYISLGELRKIPMLYPDEHILVSFKNKVNSLVTRIHNNSLKNESLIKMRDTLLPKLMSGEIDVSEIDV